MCFLVIFFGVLVAASFLDPDITVGSRLFIKAILAPSVGRVRRRLMYEGSPKIFAGADECF